MTTEPTTPAPASRRGLLLGAAALPAVALALRPTRAHAADPDTGIDSATLAAVRSNTDDSPAQGYLVTDLGQEGIYLLDSADTASPDDTGLTLVTAAGRRYKRITDGAVDVRWFGATGDGDTDDTDAVRAAIAAASGLGAERPIVIFPSAVGYRVSDTIHVPVRVDVGMHAPLFYAGPADRAALDIGVHDEPLHRGSFRLDVRRPTGETGYGDWSDEDHVGIVMRNFTTCTVEIVMARGFTIGAQCYGDSAGFAYNTIQLGHFLANKLGLDVTNRSLGNGIGWVCENLFLSGRFAADATNTGQSRYGLRIRSTDGTYPKNDNNVFLKPSFELSAASAGPGEAVPILMESGVLNRFESCRFEGNSAPDVRITGEQTMENVITAGYGILRVEDNSGYRSTELRGARDRFVNFTGAIFNSGALAENAVYHDGESTLAIPQLAFSSPSSGGVLAAGRATLHDEWIEIGDGDDAVGVWVNTDENKRFVLRRDTVASHSGRVHLVCYDAAGNQLNDPDGGPEAALVSSVFMTRMEWEDTLFGGCYRTVADHSDLPHTNDVYFSVTSDVARIRLLLGHGTTSLQLRAFSLYAVDNGSPLVWSGVKQTSTTPAVLRPPTQGHWPRGTYLSNAEARVRGRFVTDGWRKVTDGETNELGRDWIECRTTLGP